MPFATHFLSSLFSIYFRSITHPNRHQIASGSLGFRIHVHELPERGSVSWHLQVCKLMHHNIIMHKCRHFQQTVGNPDCFGSRVTGSERACILLGRITYLLPEKFTTKIPFVECSSTLFQYGISIFIREFVFTSPRLETLFCPLNVF